MIGVGTIDLMKKGLRVYSVYPFVADFAGVGTIDLMKKGLRDMT